MNRMQRWQYNRQAEGLIEMMIAVVLGALVLGAAIAVFQSNQRTYSANEGQNRIQESARVAYEMMTRDVRSVGSSACSNEALVMGTDATSLKFRAPITGSATELTATSADDLSYRVKAGSASTVTLTENGPVASDIFKAGDIVMVCNAAMTGFAEVASTAGQAVLFKVPLEFDPTDTAGAAAGSISIARMRSSRWYVDNNARGGKSLFVSRLGNAGEEVAEGVQSLGFTFHQSSGGNTAIYVAAPTDWNYVDAVRVTIPLQSTMQLKTGENRVINRTVSTGVSVRSRNL
jgi:type IV pilus assembly protein PilW